MAELITLFSSQITNRRFDDETLRILKSLTLCKDVKSLVEVKCSLIQFMRSQFLSILREIKEKSVEDKLFVLDFLVRAFVLIGDVESCLALKYEALLLREMRSSSYQFLQVSYEEWLNFAGQLIDNGFHSTARQVCENAIACLQKDDFANAETSQFYKRIQRLKNLAVNFAGSGSGMSLPSHS